MYKRQVFKTIGPKHFLIDEVSPRFAALTKEGTPFVGFKNMEQIAEHSLEENLADVKRLKEEYPDKVLIASIMGTNEEDLSLIHISCPITAASIISLKRGRLCRFWQIWGL